jgi:hypothetical protein
LLIRSWLDDGSGELENRKAVTWNTFGTLVGICFGGGLPVTGKKVAQILRPFQIALLGRQGECLLCRLNGLGITTRLFVHFRQFREKA